MSIYAGQPGETVPESMSSRNVTQALQRPAVGKLQVKDSGMKDAQTVSPHC